MKIATLALAILALTASPATADTFTYAGQHPAPAVLQRLAGQAQQFWADRTVTGCPDGITAYQAPEVIDAGWATGGWCDIWLSDSLVSTLTDPTTMQGDLLDACTAVTHEVGHALGLAHSAAGVMAGTGSPAVRYGWAPYFCWPWSRAEMRRQLQANHVRKRAWRWYILHVADFT